VLYGNALQHPSERYHGGHAVRSEVTISLMILPHVAGSFRGAFIPGYYSCPISLKLQYRTSPRMMWSTTSIPITTPAAANRSVNSTSSALGLGSPEG
jgi:hypothetical protein